MTFDEARRALGIQPLAYTEDDVRRAYASALKLNHPDVGGDVGNRGLDYLREAKDTLLKLVSEPTGVTSCEKCKGTGIVKGVTLFGAKCPACKGSGNAVLYRR